MIHVYQKKVKGVWYGAAVQNIRVLATNFSLEKQDLRNLLGRLPSNVKFQVAEEPNRFLKEVLGALEEIFRGENRGSYAFKINMDFLSSYTREVLNCTRRVPVGYVTTYSAIAEVAGGSARSVGRIEALNRFPLLVPCHRVVRSDLSIGGYRYGERVKLELLRREERGYGKAKHLRVKDGRLALFPAKRVKQTVI